MSRSAVCYGLFDGDRIVGFMGVLHFPHPNNRKIKAVTRLVILPDYQGIGLGRKFLNAVGDMYVAQGYDFMICTSAKNLMMALRNDPTWVMSRYGKVSPLSHNGIPALAKTLSISRITSSFFKKK